MTWYWPNKDELNMLEFRKVLSIQQDIAISLTIIIQPTSNLFCN